MKHLLWITALLAGFTASPHASDRIVAVVNDQVITQSQLDGRVALNVRQLGLTNASNAQKAAVVKRTLSSLIDEELQRQYALSAKLKMTDADIARVRQTAIKTLGGEAQWSELTRGLELSANDKLAAEALWQKIIARDIQPRVQVNTNEADRLISELAKSRHVLDREISVIQLNSGKDAEEDKAQLNKLTELKGKITAGEGFNDLARAYSDDKSAAAGGNLGWFGSGELNPQLEDALDKMQPGQVSEPIRTPLGWYLVKLENVRTTKPVSTEPQTQLEVFLLAATTPTDAKALKALEKQLDKATGKMSTPTKVRDYFSKGEYAENFGASKSLGWVVQNDLDETLGKVVGSTRVGSWSDSVSVNGTTARVFVGDTKQIMPAQLDAYRERVMNNLYGSRVELESRRFMQTLRQRAFLDVRL